MASDTTRKPLVAIVGATGTGKSELAVALAQRFNGEVVNGDAMQLYDGLPIITNKILFEERKGIPHHLLGVVGLDQEPWRVGKFTRTALRVIEEIRSRGRLPILVGGTHYYTQSLLFQDSLADEVEEPVTVDLSEEDKLLRWPILGKPTDEILARLKEVDPVMADRWHPNDRRKVQRSLEIWLKTGRLASDVYAEQSKRRGPITPSTGGMKGEYNSVQAFEAGDANELNHVSRLRFSTLVLWVHASPGNLKPRLDKRVDKMIDEGLLSEVETLDRYSQGLESAGRVIDKTRGIWVSIGYKEFEPYTSAHRSCSLSENELEAIKAAAVEQTKAATRQYAKKQVRWIRIKLMNALSAAAVTDNMFLLDGSDVKDWSASVEKPAIELVEAFLDGKTLPRPASLSTAAKEMLIPTRDYDVSERRDLWVRKSCDVCGLTAVLEEDWLRHLKSKKHRTVMKRKARAQKQAPTALED
ncbi:MAG: hypothetical protein M1812_003837 [Candelaria pacifica]|nr:MAG: hypothetical protein M1812_003837 [Candelaria pacifica]